MPGDDYNSDWSDDEQPVGPSLKQAIKGGRTWKQRAYNVWHWAWAPSHREKLWNKFVNIKYPLILKQLAQFIVSMVALPAVLTEFFVVAPIVIAGGVAMTIYLDLSNRVLDFIYNVFSAGKYNELKKESVLFGDRILVLGRAMWEALTGYWPKSFAGKVFHLCIVKPIQLAMTPVLLAAALTQELLVAASIGIAAALIAIPPLLTFTAYIVVNLPVILVNALLNLCCCSKSRRWKDEPLSFDNSNGPESSHQSQYGSSAAQRMSKAPNARKYGVSVYEASSEENSKSHSWCGFLDRRGTPVPAYMVSEEVSSFANR